MTEWWVFAGVYVAVVIIATVRLVRGHVRTELARRTLMRTERDIKARATQVKVVGAAGARVPVGTSDPDCRTRTWNMRARTFELRGDSGTVTVAEGASLTLLVDPTHVAISDGVASIPAGTVLMYVPDPPPIAMAPHRTAGNSAFVPGDALLLFEPGAPLFTTPRLVREVAWARVFVFFVVYVETLSLSWQGAPASAWNVLAFFLLGMLLLEQVFLRGAALLYVTSKRPT